MGTLAGGRPRARAGALLMSAALVTGLAACDGSGLDAGYSVEGALAELPAPEPGTSVMIQTADLVGATEAAGLERPDRLDSDALVDWLGPLTGIAGEEGFAPVFVPVASLFNATRLAQHQEFVDELGFSILDVDSFVEQSTPPQTFTVLAGGFDESSLSPDLPEVADGVVTAGEGEDLTFDPDAITVARPTGAPLRLAERDGLIAASPSTDAVAGWEAGPSETLADDAGLSAVAGALDDADAVAAVLVAGQSMSVADALGGRATPEQLAAIEAQLTLPPEFTSVGVGWSADDGEPVVTIAYYFDDEADAAAAVPAFESMFAEGAMIASALPLSDYLVLEDASQDGQVVTLSAAPAADRPAALAFTMLMNADLPFVHQ